VQALRHPARFLAILAIVLSAALLGNAGTAAAANPLLCFDGTTDTANGQTGGVTYGGHCTLNAAHTGATLDNSVAIGSGDYSGVNFATSSLSGKPLSQVTDLSFTYTGTPTAGSPRISLPIDTNGDGTTDFYAFIGAFYCNDGAGNARPISGTAHGVTLPSAESARAKAPSGCRRSRSGRSPAQCRRRAAWRAARRPAPQRFRARSAPPRAVR